MPDRRLLLASSSPRRKAILEQIQVPCEVLSPPDVDESVRPGEQPAHYVIRLAESKARAGVTALHNACTETVAAHRPDAAHQLLSGVAILGSDTAVVMDGKILGKPAHRQQAQAMLSSMLGREHQVLSGVTLLTDEGIRSAVSTTQVRFRTLTEQQLAFYLALDEPYDKAGAYGIQGAGAVLVSSIQGSYTNVVGLPVEVLLPLLDWAGVSWWPGLEG